MTEAASDTHEKVVGYLTVALTTAARMVEVASHRRTQETREAALRSQEAARGVQAQTRTEAAVVRHDLRDVDLKEWWDKATVEQVAGGYATARAYGSVDQVLARTAGHMAEEIRARYGVDADQLVAAAEETARAYQSRGIDPPKLLLTTPEERAVSAEAEAYVKSVTERGADPEVQQQAAVEAESGAERRRDQVEAGVLTTEADVVDALGAERAAAAETKLAWHDPVLQAQREKAGGYNDPRMPEARQQQKAAAWDDSSRRESLAERVKASAGTTAAETRMVADVAQGKPVAASTSVGKSTPKAPTARQVPSRAAERVRGR